MAEVFPDPVGNCRFCGGPTWGGDEEGPAHPCCRHPVTMCAACGNRLDPYLIRRRERLHVGCGYPGYPCPSCAESRRAIAANQRRTRGGPHRTR